MEVTTFDDLNLNKPLFRAIEDLGLTEPTLIQEKAFPVIMSGKDVVGIAQTGTGKTFAYLMPCVRRWTYNKNLRYPSTVIIVPTRELVAQVVEQVEKLAKYTNIKVTGAFGGVNINRHIAAVNEGVDILVATPGRLHDLYLKGVLKYNDIRHLIIDEVDEMLELGFRPQLLRILDYIPEKRQNLLFSATMTDEVESLINTFFFNPVKIEAARTGTPLENIVQSFYQVPNFNTKVNLLALLVEDKKFEKVLVFSSTKKMADQLFERIKLDLGEAVSVIHSNKAQNKRFSTVQEFHEGKIKVLIATDIVARGIDISEVSHVINFDVPEIPINYMHRIGRTGRADKKGISITFSTPKEEENKIAIEILMNKEVDFSALPEGLEISDQLTEDEMPKIQMPDIIAKNTRRKKKSNAHEPKRTKRSGGSRTRKK